VTPRLRLAILLASVVVLAAHAPTMPRTLEDIDSINFALGVESFDVASHRPHPPGYPVFIALAKVSTRTVAVLAPSWDRDRRAAVGLAVWGLVAATLAVWVFTLFWMAAGLSPVLAFLAALLAVASPLFWFTASRPLSDTPGLVAAVAVQAGLLRGLRASHAAGRMPRGWIWAALGAGLAAGLRSQTVWLTGPLLCWWAGDLLARRRAADAARLLGAAVAGVALWAVPLVWLSGGPGAYLAALRSQGAQDFGGVEMLATSPSWHLAREILQRTFVEPWQARGLSHAVLLLAVAGLVRVAWRNRPVLVAAIVSFVPYLVFHAAFQESVTYRYGLPMIVPVAGLAVAGLSLLGVRIAVAGAAVAAASGLVIAQPRLQAYAREGAPVFRAFEDMQQARTALPLAPAVYMHHQVWWGVRRVSDWYRPFWDVGPQPFPGAREWLAIVQHWDSGDARPVWFLTDITRTDIALFDPRARRLGGRYVEPAAQRALIGGVRLDSLNWWIIDRPAWMLGLGWSLTPEVAGMTVADRATPDRQPAVAFLLRQHQPMRLMIGGRYLAPPGGPPAVVTAELDDRPLDRWTVGGDPSGVVRWIDLPDGVPDGAGLYAELRVRVASADPSRPAPFVGLEQFDAAPASGAIYAFDAGWHEPEEDPGTGRRWRWTSARSTIEIASGAGDLSLELTGESPLRYFDRAPTVVVSAGDRELARFHPDADFTQRIDLPASALAASAGRVTIATDLTFSPSERGPSPDRRRLGLRIYGVRVTPR
jgi:hypothetical protein